LSWRARIPILALMPAINTDLFDTALSPQDQLDESLAQASAGSGDRASQADGLQESPQELAEETFTDLSRASLDQVNQEQFFDEATPETIEDQEMAATLVNSVSASVTESEAGALQQVSPGRVLSLLEL
jgi:hypothetical protein